MSETPEPEAHYEAVGRSKAERMAKQMDSHFVMLMTETDEERAERKRLEVACPSCGGATILEYRPTDYHANGGPGAHRSPDARRCGKCFLLWRAHGPDPKNWTQTERIRWTVETYK